MRTASTALFLLLLAMPATAQEREIRSAGLPPQLERQLLRLYDGGAERLDGPAAVEEGKVVRGPVAAMGGPLRVAGRVEGDVVMVDGDVVVEPGGSITGDVTVVGGEVRLGDQASVGGTITTYALAARDRRQPWDHDRPRTDRDRDRDRDRDGDDDRDGEWDWEWDGDGDEDNGWWDRRRRERGDRGFSRLTVRTGASYNRVEGLPIMFGPLIQTAGRNPLRLEALAIWRSESGASLDTDRMGYQVKAEQFLGGDRRYSVGASAFSVIEPLDRWQLTDLEASLATVLFHDDFRDHYGRTGWSGFARVLPTAGVEARVEYRHEEHGARAAGDPWTLFQRDDEWRYQPLVAEGELDVLSASLELDGRDRRRGFGEGWLLRASIERPVRGALTRPSLSPIITDPMIGLPDPDVPALDVDTDFTTALVDLRRYSPVGYRSQLNVRLVAGGSVDGSPLPAQFQHALGGPGTLPGFPTFHADCGARGFAGSHEGERYFRGYGCDRFALAQVEYRGDLSLDFGFGQPDYDDRDWWGWHDIDFNPRWVVFLDAGRGWGYGEPSFPGDTDTGTLVDVGLGFLIDQLGIYAALPLNGDVAQEPRFFVRLGRRF